MVRFRPLSTILPVIDIKPCPTPLILEFVEIVLAVAPVAIELGDHRRIHLFIVRDKCAVIPFSPLAVFDELKLLLLRTNWRSRNHDSVLRRRGCDVIKKMVRKNVFRHCFNCGYESFDPEHVIRHEGESYTVEGFIKCHKCKKKQHAWIGMRDRRRQL